MSSIETARRFLDLFGGVDRIGQIGAFGTGKGEWVKRPLELNDAYLHLQGAGSGIGVGPLLPDNTCMFAAIDLDEPDFDAAREMQEYLPGASFVERSRSGNAHVWVFFSEPCVAWVAMGILKEATLAAGKKGVEVFPKNPDFSRVKYGNYINLPYHGKERPIINYLEADDPHNPTDEPGWDTWDLTDFLRFAAEGRNDPQKWERRAEYMMIENPFERRAERSQEFGTKPELHRCAEYIIANCDDNPVVEGHRAAVFFALAKMLTNCALFDHAEALDLMQEVNSASPDPAPLSELRRILGNAERGQYTSTDCDSALVLPYADPECPIVRAGAANA